ncbi:MAG: hypothetical protein U0R51_01760 [Solirubrobacterales bacterium]
MGSRAFAALAAAAATCLIAASFAAAAGSAKSSLTIVDAGTQNGSYLSTGIVESDEKACVADRKVKFIVKRPGGKETLDTARTSDRGGWFSKVPESEYTDGGVTGTLYKLVPRKVKKGGGKIRCGGLKVAPA